MQAKGREWYCRAISRNLHVKHVASMKQWEIHAQPTQSADADEQSSKKLKSLGKYDTSQRSWYQGK